MTVLTDTQLAAVASQAGFTGAGLTLAVAIALAESGGDTEASLFNDPTSSCPDGSTDRGLWQINDCWHSEFTDDVCYDALGCARAAYVISNHGGDWSPWTTYKTESYKQFMPRAEVAVRGQNGYSVQPGDTLSAVASKLQVTVDALEAANQWLLNRPGGYDHLEVGDHLHVP